MTETIGKVLKGLSNAVLKEVAKQALSALPVDEAFEIVKKWVSDNEMWEDVDNAAPRQEN